MGDRTMAPPPRGPANPRKKFAVKPGFSMLDWNLLKSRAKNLAGQDEGGMRKITKAEVRQHNTEHDCWSIFRGKVYNLTPFLHYHPGGVPEIMKGAGRDCTALFNKYHPWVNFDSLVGNLCIGTLLTEKDIAKAEKNAAAKAAKALTGHEDSPAEGKSDEGKGQERKGDERKGDESQDEEREEHEVTKEEKLDLTVDQLRKMSANGRDELSRADSREAASRDG